jgi:hypothetical protein
VNPDGGELEDEVEVPFTAPFDPVIAERLDRPSSVEAIWEEASVNRPISTGDIFRGAPVAGASPDETAHDLTMLLAHPSAMRRGAELEPRIRGACVLPTKGVRKSEWTDGFYDSLPLPGLSQAAAQSGATVKNAPWAALFSTSGAVDSSLLKVDDRVASLSHVGVHLLLQKLVHADTRVAVSIPTLAATFAPKLDEIELLQLWNEDVLGDAGLTGDELQARLRAEAEAFETFLDLGRADVTVRKMLADPQRAGEARRLIMEELRRRRG